VSDLGFKRLTPETWLEPDPTNGAFGGFPPAEDILGHIFEPRLSEKVPNEIRQLFEAARGAMCHGYVFYPLWTLAAEQLFRVVEGATSFRCRELGAPRKVRTFEDKIKFLNAQPDASPVEINWHAVRFLRNEASHPKQQTLVPAAMALPVVQGTARALNQLFQGPCVTP
jgi:hypothetical protein